MANHKEAREQKKLAKFCDKRFGSFWWHTPNGGMRLGSHGAWLVAEGMKSGIPDVIIVAPFVHAGGRAYVGCAIELKPPYETVTKKRYPSLLQRLWLLVLKWAGFYTAVCWGAAESKALLLELYGDTPTPDKGGRPLRVCWGCMHEMHPRIAETHRHRCMRAEHETCQSRIVTFRTLQDVLTKTVVAHALRKQRPTPRKQNALAEAVRSRNPAPAWMAKKERPQ